MFERAIRQISDIHGRIERVLNSSTIETFSGANKSIVDTTKDQLLTVRTRLDHIQQSLTDPLWVILLGRFSSGKSCLINAFFQCSGGSEIRATGRQPTDKQATVVLHESVNIGLVLSHPTVVNVDGLQLLVQQHDLDKLRPLLLVDTPGLLDEEEIDDALMEFVQHADVVLHCMTPDAHLIRPDRELLGKRQKYFPSQIYHLVTTKADTVYRRKDENEWVFDENEWEKDLQALSYRYSSYTKQNLDLRPNAKTNKVWLVDSISGFNVEKLLGELLELANDLVDDVPRVRAPVVRDRLGYVTSTTRNEVIHPCISITHQLIDDIEYAKDRLQTQLNRYRETILSSASDILLLKIQVLQSSAIPVTMEDNIAAALEISSLVDFKEYQNVMLSGLITHLAGGLFWQIERWKQALASVPEIRDVYRLHDYHQDNFRTARNSMRRNAIPEYIGWFTGLQNGRRWLSFLRLNTIEELLSSKQIQEDINSDDGSVIETQVQTERNILFNVENVTEKMMKHFLEGTNLILENAKGDVDDSLVSEIWRRVGTSLSRTRQIYHNKSMDIKEEGDTADENIQFIVDSVNRTRANVVQRTVENMKQDFHATVGDIRGELLEKGIATKLRSDSDVVWGNATRTLDYSISRVVEEKLEVPIRRELLKLRQVISDELKMVNEKLKTYEENVSEWFAPDISTLKSSEKNLADTAREKTAVFTSALKVFDEVESESNYFTQHGIGDRFRADMNSELGNALAIWANRKRTIQISLAISTVLSLAFSAFFVTPIGATLSKLGENFLLIFLGTAVTGSLTSIWQYLTFGSKAKSELERIVQEQIDKVAHQATGHLGESEKKEINKFNATRIAFLQLVDYFAYNGVQALYQHLINQLRDRMDRFSNQVSSDQTQTAKRIRANLVLFRSTCQRLLSQTAESCGEVLEAKAFEIILENKETVDDKLDSVQRELKEIAAILEEARNELTASIQLTY